MLVWRLVKLLPVTVTERMAAACYVGVATDTGNFSFSNADAEAFSAVSEMVKTGFDLAALSEKLFRIRSLQKTKAIGVCVDRLRLSKDGMVAVSGMSLEDFAATGATESDTEGASGFLRDIDTVEAAAFLRETAPGKFKASVRSKNLLDVAAICKGFGGGGHKRAAGCFMYGDLQKVMDDMMAALTKALDEVR